MELESVSIVLPAKNEANSLRRILPALTRLYPSCEIIVVNDGSTDDTVSVCGENNVRVVSHAYSKGNGAAIKSGALAAKGEWLVFMDADSQHDPAHVKDLVDMAFGNEGVGYDMVVVARQATDQANISRSLGNRMYNWLASYMTGHKIPDLTSGFRVINAKKFKKFISLLPNGFSYPTTITMAFFRAGFSVGYLNRPVGARIGKSHIHLLKDGTRFFLIIFKIGTLYSPLKLFFPIAVAHFFAGISYYFYTFFEFHRFTNMSALLFTTSILIFLIGLVSEQITSLIYSKTDSDQ